MRHKHHCAPSHRGWAARELANRAAPCGQGWIDFPIRSFDDVILACKVAEIHGVVERLPQGYNTLLGEHGVGLSGGQKQRLAIARAILKRPKILIFDEATSSLDPRTAESFARTVNQLKGSATILFIAHAVPRGLEVDEMLRFGPRPVPMEEVGEF